MAWMVKMVNWTKDCGKGIGDKVKYIYTYI